MMLIVVVVVTQYPPVVHSTNNVIDIGKVVLDDRSVLVFPHFLSQPCAPAWSSQYDFLVQDLRSWRLRTLLNHRSIVADEMFNVTTDGKERLMVTSRFINPSVNPLSASSGTLFVRLITVTRSNSTLPSRHSAASRRLFGIRRKPFTIFQNLYFACFHKLCVIKCQSPLPRLLECSWVTEYRPVTKRPSANRRAFSR